MSKKVASKVSKAIGKKEDWEDYYIVYETGLAAALMYRGIDCISIQKDANSNIQYYRFPNNWEVRNVVNAYYRGDLRVDAKKFANFPITTAEIRGKELKDQYSPTSVRSVYFSDFGQLLTDITSEIINESRGEQYACCGPESFDNGSKCRCIVNKRKKDGKQEWYMSSGQMPYDTASRLVMEIANKAIEAIREESFLCECPQRKVKKASKKNKRHV